jgi:hypothetical protein
MVAFRFVRKAAMLFKVQAKTFMRLIAVGIVVAVVGALVMRRAPLDERDQRVVATNPGSVNSFTKQTRSPISAAHQQSPSEQGGSVVEAILAAVEKETDPVVREFVIEDFVGTLPIYQIPSAIAELKGRSDFVREINTQLIRKWAGSDPNAAAAWAQNESPAADRQLLANSIATVWADQDLSAAIAWVHQLEPEVREGALVKTAYEAVDKDLTQALELAREISTDAARNDLVEHIAAEWAAKQPKAIAEWATQIRDDGLRERISVGIAASWAESDPAAAATFAISSIQPGKAQDDAVISVVERWVQSKPAEAAGWVTQFPEGRLRDVAIVEIVKGWSQQNASDTQRWVEGLSPGTTADLAAQTLSQIKIPQPPAEQIAE